MTRGLGVASLSGGIRETANARYLAPPLAVLGVLAGSCLGLLGVLFDSRLLRLGFLAPAGYLALIIGGSVATGQPMSAAARLRLPAGVGGDASLLGCGLPHWLPACSSVTI